MDNRKDDAYYVQKITADLKFVTEHTKNLTAETIDDDEVLLDSILFRLIQISENADRLTQGFKAQYPHLPWRAIKGMRNRIVHEYGDVELSVVFQTVKYDIPALLDIFSTL